LVAEEFFMPECTSGTEKRLTFIFEVSTSGTEKKSSLRFEWASFTTTSSFH
jgi:hypothetical protein